jgi:uncharacterized ion transporter superfamily protein YfcC
MLVAGLAVWIAWTMYHAARTRKAARAIRLPGDESIAHKRVSAMSAKHALIMALILTPLVAYIYGALKLDWGLNELGAGFMVAGLIAGMAGGLGVTGTVTAFLDGMMSVLSATTMIGVARSISLVLDDGRVVDTILHALVTPLEHVPAITSVLLMIPFHALVHIPVPSASGQAVLTMPLFVPVADLLGYSREAAVLTYQTGAGLMEMVTPTNGALMAVLLAAGVPLQRWLRFAAVGLALLVLIGVAGAALAM